MFTVASMTLLPSPTCSLLCGAPGAGVQRPPEEGLPKRHHALGHAPPGRIQLPLAGPGPTGEE